MRWLLLAGRRALAREPMQLLLALTGIALGVAVVVAVGIANRAAQESLDAAVTRVAGAATHQVVASAPGVPDSVYRRLRVDVGVDRALPVVSARVSANGQRLELLGIDPLVAGPFRGGLMPGGADGLPVSMLTHDDRVAVTSGTASALGVSAGDTLSLQVDGKRTPVTVAAVRSSADSRLDGVVLADIAAAQALLGRVEWLTRIDLILDEAMVAPVRAALPAGVELLEAGRRQAALAGMSAAFHTNLRALSLLALVVGLFLVFNTMSFLVVRRRRMLATLRAVGATRAQITAQVLADAVVLGIAGTLGGLPLGLALGAGLTGLVATTVDELYFAIGAAHWWQPTVLITGGLLGLLGPLAAAVPAALEAAGVTPRAGLQRAHLERGARRSARRMAWGGVAALILGVAVVALSGGLLGGFTGLFALILGAALLAPVWVRLLAQCAGRGRLGWRLAVRAAAASLSRTGVAVAALAVAVATVIGVATMIGSFRASVVDWLEHSLNADYYLGAEGGLPPELAGQVAALPGVDHLTRSRRARLPVADGFLSLAAVTVAPEDRAGYPLVAGGDHAWQRFEHARAVLVSEPLAARRDLSVGDALALPAPAGPATFTVAGVYRDYANVRGTVLMRLGLYRDVWQDDSLTGLGVHLAADTRMADSRRRLRAMLPAAVAITDNRAVFRRSLAVFDQTFRVTGVLRVLAAVVAFVGVLGALMALELERAGEVAVLRALGLTRAGVAGQVFAQSGFLGAAAGLWALPLGLALAWLLVAVINHRAFGWTLTFTVQWGALVQGFGLAVAAALLAAMWPAWRLARRQPADGLMRE